MFKPHWNEIPSSGIHWDNDDEDAKLGHITQEQFDAVYASHRAWLRREVDESTQGCRLNLVGLDLYGINMSHLDLAGAHFSHVAFPLQVQHTDLSSAVLDHCDLSRRGFWHCDLSNATIKHCNFDDSKWFMSTLQMVTISYSSLKDLDLEMCRVSFSPYARTHGFLMTNTMSLDSFLSHYGNNDIMPYILTNCDPEIHVSQQCPTHGAFIGWKKLIAYEVDGCDMDTIDYKSLVVTSEIAVPCICKLEIPASAKRSSAMGDKCRANKAKVLEIRRIDNGRKLKQAVSQWNRKFVYRVGEYVSVDDFHEDRFMECAAGIHFFVDKQAALNY